MSIMLYVLWLRRCHRPAWINWRTVWDDDVNYNDDILFLISDDFINVVPTITVLRSHFSSAKINP
jgi:hypothetical protein